MLFEYKAGVDLLFRKIYIWLSAGGNDTSVFTGLNSQIVSRKIVFPHFCNLTKTFNNGSSQTRKEFSS